MEKTADLTDTVAVVNAVDLQSPDRKVVRRRLFQPTLFSLKPQGTKLENCVKEEPEKVEDDDVECCGNQGTSRRRETKPKRNATPQKRGSKKVAVNGKDAFAVEVIDSESPDDGSPQLKKKQRVSTRKGRTNGNKGTYTAKSPTHPVVSPQASQPIPDLWLEAKRSAEENSRIFAGKQMHPFFSSWKMGKKDQETTEVENNGYLDKRKERSGDFGPIHVFENVKDDFELIDWSNWTFYDAHFNSINCNQERITTSFEGTIGSLNFDAVLHISNPMGTLVSLDQYRGALGDTSVIPASVSPIVLDEEVSSYDLLKNVEKDFGLGFISGNIGHMSSDFEQQSAILQERIMSYYLNRGNHPQNSMWTIKYQPEKASEVCGNGEAVKFINEWLRLWHAMDFHVSKMSSSVDKCLASEDDYNSHDSDYDSGNADEGPSLKNVLLVKGPVGSGKSAAIYACAKEQGFDIIEINASNWRNGALLKQKFGEALGSHSVKRSQESPVGSQSKLHLKSPPVVLTNGACDLDLNNDVLGVASLSDDDDSVGGLGMRFSGDLPCDQGEIKTLILFEDVDATLCEDRGLLSTIQQLANTGKRPMILTSNSETPLLPANLDREEVCFTMPSLKELVCHIYLVCAAEKANIKPHLIERCIHFCGGDIRRSLMYLQFWCQSKGCVKDGEVQNMYSPLMFNLEAGHHTLPKLIPLELPSSLSEFIEAEIAKSLCRTEENHSLVEVIEEEVGNTSLQNISEFDKGEMGSIEAEKGVILNGKYSPPVDNDTIAVGNTCESSNPSGSPVAFTQHNVCQKLDTMLYSNAVDEISNHGNVCFSDRLCNNDSNLPIPCPAVDDISNELGDSCNRSTEPFVRYQEANFAGIYHLHHHLNLVDMNHYSKEAPNGNLGNFEHQLSERATVNPFSYPAVEDSLDLSSDHLFPFVETKGHEIQHNLGNVSHIRFAEVGDSLNQISDQFVGISGSTDDNHSSCPPLDDFLELISHQCYEEMKIGSVEHRFLETSDADLIGCSVVGNSRNYVDPCVQRHKASEYMQCGSHINMNARLEEMGNSQSEGEHLEASTSTCHFHNKSKTFRSSRLMAKNPVQNRWDELRQTDLRQHFISEHKNALQVLELAYGISNLISEADLLLRNCIFLPNDSLDQETNLSEETSTFGWHEQQGQMASTIAQHGYCLYAKDTEILQSNMGVDNRVHLAWEILNLTNTSMALGKLLRLDGSRSQSSLVGRGLKGTPSTVDISFKREREMSSLQNIVWSIVPLRYYLALRRNVFHDYLSSLAHISRSEAFRLAEGGEKTKRRRGRIARNYLSSGGLGLSPDDISRLIEYNCYGKGDPNQSPIRR